MNENNILYLIIMLINILLFKYTFLISTVVSHIYTQKSHVTPKAFCENLQA